MVSGLERDSREKALALHIDPGSILSTNLHGGHPAPSASRIWELPLNTINRESNMLAAGFPRALLTEHHLALFGQLSQSRTRTTRKLAWRGAGVLSCTHLSHEVKESMRQLSVLY